MQFPSASEIESFYRAAMLGLLHLEQREGRGRRFGEASQAAWRALGGELDDRDRLTLLLRDGAVTHPLAFGARDVFAIPGLTEDEPFGPDWPEAPVQLAKELMKQGATNEAVAGSSPVVAAAERWNKPSAIEAAGADLVGLLERLGPSTG